MPTLKEIMNADQPKQMVEIPSDMLWVVAQLLVLRERKFYGTLEVKMQAGAQPSMVVHESIHPPKSH